MMPDQREDRAAAPGSTRFTPRALTNLARVIVAEALDVPVHRTRVTVSDEDGFVALDVAAPLPLAPLEDAGHEDDDAMQRAESAQDKVKDGFERLSGLQLASVNLRFTALSPRDRRVR